MERRNAKGEWGFKTLTTPLLKKIKILQTESDQQWTIYV